MVIDPNLTAFGRSAGSNIISTSAPAVRTVLIGSNAGQNITTGQANVIVGFAGVFLTTGGYNTIMGDLSGYNLVGGSTNTLIGYEAGQNLTTGSGNLILGSRSGKFLADGVTRFTGGTENTIVGNSIRLLTANDTNSIIIGASAFGLGSNTTVIGNSSTTFSSIFGNLGVATTTNAGFGLDVNGTARIQNQLTTTGSINASSGVGRGTYFNQTLVATANNNTLVGLDIQPTFTTGAFTGVTSIPLRIGNSDAGRGISFSNQNWSILSTAGISISYNGSVGFDFSTGLAQSTPVRFITGYTTRLIIFPTTANVGINTTTDAGFRFDVNGTTRIQGLTTSLSYTTYGSYTVASSTYNIYRSTASILPTSGNMVVNGYLYDATINQTGGASGTTRGLYIAPTLTSAFDFRSIETTVGDVMLNTVSGNTLIGTTLDTGQKLQVSGDTLINGGLTATTISATTYQNLPSNEIIINSTQIQSGFTGGILFQSSANTVTQNTGFTWDNTNSKLNIGGDLTVSGNTSLQSVTATTLSATVKMFDINHPTKEGLRLRHGNLEGPENGVYYRGTIINQKEIVLPDYWEGLVDDNTITVYLTPIGFYQTLFVVSKSNKIIIIDNKEENNHFDFIVFGERKDVDKLITEYKK
jgi:hypothetical protein